ncbi:MAG: NAD-dependent isocitrate dehydrogenase [Clostridia bacterium]|nr:NAD-dependent isocitrate dehydrogenase [Clostridia bacterium]
MHIITLIPGDGIGPEIIRETVRLIESTGADIKWEIKEAGNSAFLKHGDVLPYDVLESIKNNRVALKGPITTPVGDGFRSINVLLRKELDLYSNLRIIKNYKGVPSRYENIDLVIVRENTEDLYIGIEHMIGDDAAESIKIFTRKGCERIVRFAFDYARKENRKKVTAVHKANIMKMTDGMFLSIARTISKEYPEIQFEEMIVDAMCMKLVQSPEVYDVLVLPNLYGDIISDLCAGLVGGLGFAPGVNIGTEFAVFEAVHGSAPDIAGKNIANPTALILSAIQMLRFINEKESALKIENAMAAVLEEGKTVTRDIGGTATTSAYVDEIINHILEN